MFNNVLQTYALRVIPIPIARSQCIQKKLIRNFYFLFIEYIYTGTHIQQKALVYNMVLLSSIRYIKHHKTPYSLQ